MAGFVSWAWLQLDGLAALSAQALLKCKKNLRVNNAVLPLRDRSNNDRRLSLHERCVLRRIVYGNPTRERGIAVGSSLTRRVFKLPPKSGPSKNHPIRERMRHSHTFCGAKGDYVLPLADPIIAYINTSLTTFAGTTPVSLKSSPCERTLNRS